jgi:hypothetical protein
MLRFRRALNHLEVTEVDLAGRRYIWSNGQENPTFSRIDSLLHPSVGRDVPKSYLASLVFLCFRSLPPYS